VCAVLLWCTSCGLPGIFVKGRGCSRGKRARPCSRIYDPGFSLAKDVSTSFCSAGFEPIYLDPGDSGSSYDLAGSGETLAPAISQGSSHQMLRIAQRAFGAGRWRPVSPAQALAGECACERRGGAVLHRRDSRKCWPGMRVLASCAALPGLLKRHSSTTGSAVSSQGTQPSQQLLVEDRSAGSV
jgi:hypothetical protein